MARFLGPIEKMEKIGFMTRPAAWVKRLARLVSGARGDGLSSRCSDPFAGWLSGAICAMLSWDLDLGRECFLSCSCGM